MKIYATHEGLVISSSPIFSRTVSRTRSHLYTYFQYQYAKSQNINCLQKK